MPTPEVKRADYLGYPVGGTPQNRGTGYDQNYLGSDPNHQREYSVDIAHEGEAYGLQDLQRSTSRSPLHTPAVGEESYPIPFDAHPTPPQPAAATPSPAQARVHYPPSPYSSTAQPTPPVQTYTNVPLRDYVASPSPNVSGTSTPVGSGNKKKQWGFRPMQANASLESGLGGDAEKKSKRPKSSRGASWDLLGERAEWEEYNVADASVENLRYAQGDVGTNRLSKLYYWALNRGIVVRWALYIIPVLALLWIPGSIGVTASKDAKVWEVKLIWWSIWLTILWGGFWAATAVFLMAPAIWRNTVGSIIPNAQRYTGIIRALGRYAKLIVWAAAIWITFTPIIINHYTGEDEASSRSSLSTFANLLFGLFLCSIVLGVEKLIVQLIAFQFHRDSYEDRLNEQKFQVKCLTTMYIHSHDIPGRSDTLTDAQSTRTKPGQMPRLALRKALKGLKEVAQTTTTALGNVATEMAGQSVLQTNSPANRVTAALTSANKSKALARRLFYSFRQPGRDHLNIGDIVRFFPDLETAEAAFNVFDKDGNGDATRDEIEAAVLILHRERLSLEASMRDLDGAVRRLNDIFMVVVGAIVILVMAAMVTTKLTTLVTSAGTFILGLSWLIGSTMQEILLACIFLFVKHPYDVGDRVDIDGNSYTVAKMQLMSTNFKRVDGKFVWIGHNILATKVIENVRRSGPTSESFSFEVAFDTSFEMLQVLRAKMLKFCKENSRDFLPIFDVIVDDIPAQGKMVLKADIKYKSNWQQGALKVQRRNKWVCALKLTLAELKIWGPAGAGNPAPDPADPTRYTLIPWDEVQAAVAANAKPDSPPPTFAAATGSSLTDKREVINDTTQDIWDESTELDLGPSRPGTPGADSGLNTPITGTVPSTGPIRRTNGPPREVVAMTSAPVARR